MVYAGNGYDCSPHGGNSGISQEWNCYGANEIADEHALKNNVRYLKTDTYSINTKMNALFVKCGYKLIGEMSFLGKEKPFYCYEKVLD